MFNQAFRLLSPILLFFSASNLCAGSEKTAKTFSENTFQFRIANVDCEWKKLNKVHNGAKQYFEIDHSHLFLKEYSMAYWISGGYSTKKGKSTARNHSTRYHYMPFGLGIKHTIALTPKLDLSLGGGGLVSFLKIRSNTEYVDSPICRWGTGAIFKAELSFKLSPTTFIGVYTSTYDQRFKIKIAEDLETSVNLSGSDYGSLLDGSGKNFCSSNF